MQAGAILDEWVTSKINGGDCTRLAPDVSIPPPDGLSLQTVRQYASGDQFLVHTFPGEFAPLDLKYEEIRTLATSANEDIQRLLGQFAANQEGHQR
jgi:hypothetical protein